MRRLKDLLKPLSMDALVLKKERGSCCLNSHRFIAPTGDGPHRRLTTGSLGGRRRLSRASLSARASQAIVNLSLRYMK